MFANCQAGGMNVASGDVCLTPQPAPAPPAPVPYVNTSQNTAATGFFDKVVLCGGFAHNVMTSIASSTGDELGSVGGVASGTSMSGTRFLDGSAKVMMGGKPATRVTSKTLQNMSNASGQTVAPGQTKVQLLG